MSTAPTNTGRRQRRRYSCGPCKSLKIKCNLQTPCRSCKKVGREDKCHEDPPRPPSSEEINISNRRKNLSQRKKHLAALSKEGHQMRGSSVELDEPLEDEPVKKFGDNSRAGTTHSISPPLVSATYNASLDGSAPASIGRSLLGDINDSVLPSEVRYSTIEENKDAQDIHGPLKNISVPGLFRSDSSTSLSDNQIYTPSASRDGSYSFSLARNSLPYQSIGNIASNPSANNYQYHDCSLWRKISKQNPIGIEPAEYPLNSSNFLLSQPNVSIKTRNQDQSYIATQSNMSLLEVENMNAKRTMFSFNNEDLNVFKRFLPTFPMLEELQKQYIMSSSKNYYNILNHDEIFVIFRDFYNVIHKLSPTDTTKIDKYSLRCISKFYCVMAIGYLLSGWESEVIVNLDKQTVIQGWINISSMIRCIIVDCYQVTDILFSIEWYFIVRDFFTYNDMILDDSASFSNAIMLLKLNKWIMDAIKKEPEESLTHMNSDISRVVEYWIYLRIIDLDVPYIMSKGTFIDSKEFENCIVPDKQTFDFLYKEFNDVSDPLRKISYQVIKLYFNRTQYTASIKLFIISYLGFFCDLTSLVTADLEQFKKDSSEPNYEPKELDLTILIRNQYCMNIIIRWLSFSTIESSHYFPTLRFTSYLTTILNSFNHFNYLDNIIMHQSQGAVSLADKLLESYSYLCFGIFLQCIVYQGMFLITLKNFNHLTNTAIDCKEIFETTKHRFYHTFTKFWNSHQVHRRLYLNLPFFQKTFDLCHEFCRILENRRKFELLNDFIFHLATNLQLYDFLSKTYFASTESLRLYVEILWQLFAHIKTTELTTQLPITNLLCLNVDLIRNSLDDLTGLLTTSQIVDEYATLVIEPSVSE